MKIYKEDGIKIVSGKISRSNSLNNWKTTGQRCVKTSLSMWEIRGSIPRPFKSNTATMSLRSCVAQPLSPGDGPHYPLHDSAQYREYNT